MRRHECVTNSRYAVIVVLILDEDGLPQQGSESDPQSVG